MTIPGDPVPDSPGTITLHLKNSNLTRSADSDNAENVIKNLYIGFYKDNSSPILSFDAPDPLNTPAIVWIERHDLDVSGAYSVTVPLTDDDARELFGDNPKTNDKCKFFVIANYFESNGVPENATINEMKQLPVKTDFMSGEQTSFVMAGEGYAFYTASASGETKGKVSGTGLLIRAAAKINLNLKFPDNIKTTDESGNEEIWTPVLDPESITVLMNNGVLTAVAAPEATELGPWWPGVNLDQSGSEDDDDAGLMMIKGLSNDLGITPEEEEDPYYSSSLNVIESIRYLTNTNTGDDYPYQMDMPFYTYPNAWSEKPEETRQSFLTLIVPWHREGDPADSNYKFYYKVPVTLDYSINTQTYSIERNTWYKIYLSVGVLGNLTPDNPKEVEELSYKIVDWNDQTVSVSIPDHRYLVVSPNVYTINNEEIISIPFFTSHPVEISDITMSYKQFNYPENESGEVVDIKISQDVIDKSISNNKIDTICNYTIVRDPISNQLNLRITHPMIMWTAVKKDGGSELFRKNGKVDENGKVDKEALDKVIESIKNYNEPPEWGKEIAYYPYTFHVTLRHRDNHLFTETVEITQYPGMYIEADENPGGNYAWLARGLSETWYGENDIQPDKLANGSNNPDAGKPSSNFGYVFVNAIQEEHEGKYYWYNDNDLGGLVRPWQRGNVINNNMYLINVTQFSDSQKDYIIGDPRMRSINNDLSGNGQLTTSYTGDAGGWCNEATALFDGPKRKLRYYYPTDETSENEMMIAPRLRIASSFGISESQKTRESCRRRCATYQEQGYPAGRWRLPTKGELEFMIWLSETQKIPNLFSDESYYMTAQGGYQYLDGELVLAPDRQNFWVRPVYDEWYWGKQTTYQLKKDGSGGYVYTLGDVPINSN